MFDTTSKSNRTSELGEAIANYGEVRFSAVGCRHDSNGKCLHCRETKKPYEAVSRQRSAGLYPANILGPRHHEEGRKGTRR